LKCQDLTSKSKTAGTFNYSSENIHRAENGQNLLPEASKYTRLNTIIYIIFSTCQSREILNYRPLAEKWLGCLVKVSPVLV